MMIYVLTRQPIAQYVVACSSNRIATLVRRSMTHLLAPVPTGVILLSNWSKQLSRNTASLYATFGFLIRTMDGVHLWIILWHCHDFDSIESNGETNDYLDEGLGNMRSWPEVLSLHLPGGAAENHEKFSARIADVPAEIRSQHLPNTSPLPLRQPKKYIIWSYLYRIN